MEKYLIKSIYIPIIGLIIAFYMMFFSDKYFNKILRERYASVYMMLSHILTFEIIIIFILSKVLN